MLSFQVLHLLIPHQGSGLDLLRVGGLHRSADPLLISLALEKAFGLLQIQFGAQKRWYDKVLGKTPSHICDKLWNG